MGALERKRNGDFSAMSQAFDSLMECLSSGVFADYLAPPAKSYNVNSSIEVDTEWQKHPFR